MALMRSSSLFPLIALLTAGCSDSITIEGDLLEAAAAAEVRAGGTSFLTEAGEFRLTDVSGDTVRLVFSGGREGDGVMTITDLPSRGRVRLHDVWIANGIAFPTRVAAGSELVTINGLRMGGAARVEGDREISGIVLAISHEDGTLWLRPDDRELPDVGIFLGTGTVLQTMDGAPVEFGRIGFGDTLIVRGTGASGYVLSNAILWGGSSEGEADSRPVPPADTEPAAEAPDPPDSGDGGRGADEDRRGNGSDRPDNRGRGRPSNTPGRRT